MAIPSSSVSPEVIYSGWPSGNAVARCTSSTHLPSGDTYDRRAIPPVLAGTYTSCVPVQFSSDASSAMWMSWFFTSENNTRLLPNQARPVAFVRNGRGWPLMTGTTNVPPHSTPGLTVYAMRSPSGDC
jgi:hypothetical protein